MTLYMRPDGHLEVTPADVTRRMLRKLKALPRRGGRDKGRGRGKQHTGKARR